MKKNSLIDRVLANYEVKRLIGRGGMAEVYYGLDIKLQRQVAIKVFDVQNRSGKSQASRFIQEARMMAQWRHDNIVQIYYAGDETGLYYYVMEFIDGYDLASIMSVYAEKGELMPISDVLRIGEAIANALDYAHAKGVIHRDVKPANVMIANDGRVVLTDFGLALDVNDKSQGEVFGSPHYISPEQARRSSDAVPQSDLYSLGVILYEMLTGETPFNDPSPATLALQHITEVPPPLRNINPNLSKAVEDVILKALEKRPADRYQSGKNLLEALDKALAVNPEPVPADAPPLPPIPVNAPTVRRSTISLNSFTKRGDIVTALEEKSTTTKNGFPADVAILQQPSRRKLGWGTFIFVALLLLAFLLGSRYASSVSSSLFPLAIADTQQVSVQGSPISVQETAPSLTHVATTATLTSTPTLPPTFTATSSPSVTPTALPTDTTTPGSAAPITNVKYPNGYLITAYYNESSFYLINLGSGSRSVSAFTFERVNDDGTFQDRFEGWEWQKYYDVIRSKRCLSLVVEAVPTPTSYLEPVDCQKKILSNLGFAPTSKKLFWTPKDDSHEFRILWLDEEVGRCEIKIGACNFYVP